MITTHHRLILASGSICRKWLLEQAQLEFEIIPSDVDETAIKETVEGEAPEDLAEILAQAKAQAVSEQHPNAYVIGGDQICAYGDQILDKPGLASTAIEHLTMLSGQKHKQISAVCIYKNGECLWSFVDVAYLTMRELSDQEIANYITLDEPLASCGAYKFESLGCHLFSEVEGAADTIKGMPLIPLLGALRDLGVYSLA